MKWLTTSKNAPTNKKSPAAASKPLEGPAIVKDCSIQRPHVKRSPCPSVKDEELPVGVQLAGGEKLREAGLTGKNVHVGECGPYRLEKTIAAALCCVGLFLVGLCLLGNTWQEESEFVGVDLGNAWPEKSEFVGVDLGNEGRDLGNEGREESEFVGVACTLMFCWDVVFIENLPSFDPVDVTYKFKIYVDDAFAEASISGDWNTTNSHSNVFDTFESSADRLAVHPPGGDLSNAKKVGMVVTRAFTGEVVLDVSTSANFSCWRPNGPHCGPVCCDMTWSLAPDIAGEVLVAVKNEGENFSADGDTSDDSSGAFSTVWSWGRAFTLACMIWGSNP